MGNRRYWRILIWTGLIFFGISFFEHGVWGHSLTLSMRHRILGHSSPLTGEKSEPQNPIQEVVISGKRNRDFDYFSGIFRVLSGKPYQRNRGIHNQYRRYILREGREMAEENGNSMEDLSGVYAVVLLKDSLRNWMNRGTITLEYIRYGSQEVQCLHFPIGERDVADGGQIFIFLDPERKNRKKFVAWKVTLHDPNSNVSFSKESFSWKMLGRDR